MSDTPRTDAAEIGFAHKVVPSDFARKLERELAAVRGALKPFAACNPSFPPIKPSECWLWKPQDSHKDNLPGINVAHILAAKTAMEEAP